MTYIKEMMKYLILVDLVKLEISLDKENDFALFL